MNDDDPFDPPPSRHGLLVAAILMLAVAIFCWSFIAGWRPW
ncbi:hypothetical protein [Bosea sp. (in: a-proteobacteria)]|nr:hypothetical protein [Bosea sp. (in: a-proteobacteria)]MDP3408239.1 hypothetical protein [Bosea sp. (in: a-proteobacteria)]